jgi:hypothetical protein
MADDEINFPALLQIPLPRPIQYGSGITATSGPYGCHILYRGLKSERDKLHEAAALLGISYGAFIRCLVNDAADFVIKVAREQQASDASQVDPSNSD